MVFKSNPMKKVSIPIVSILLAIFLSSEIAFAQGGNLQFNQVINHNLTGTVNMNFADGAIYPVVQTLTFTIPAGKVWKVESASVNLKPESVLNSYFSYNVYDQTILMLNKIELAKEQSGYGSNKSPTNIKYPFWIPSGSYSLKLTGEYSNIYPNPYTYRAYGFLSAIEYNIVP